MDEEKIFDAFAPVTGTHALHRSLDTFNKLPIDFYEPLVSGFLQDEIYVKWSAGYRPWQLHCYGGPGCGKSTFAVRVVHDLQERFKHKNTFVAYIRIKEHVSENHASFVEDFLFCLYTQISLQTAHAYKKSCQDGDACSERLRHIREALYQQLVANDHNFLILDGYDTLDLASCLLIDHELHDPRLSNLSLLVTRRNPPYQQPPKLYAGCDKCGRNPLSLYWGCQICGPLGPQYCYDCQEADVLLCTNQDHKLALLEPYDHVELNINRAWYKESHSPMKSFVQQALETKFGCTTVVDDVSTSISERVGGNVNLAKLRIDDLLSMDTLEDSRKPNDRLPRSVVAFFDSEIDQLLERNPVDRDIALMSIAAVANNEQDINGFGTKVVELERAMRHELSSSSHLARRPTRSLEDIIAATNGLLVLQPYEDSLYVACFNQMFKYYVKERYNESLHLAKLKLRFNEVVEREKTALWNIGVATASPRTLSDGFDTKDYVNARNSSQDSAYYSRTSSITVAQDSDIAPSQTIEPKGLLASKKGSSAQGNGCGAEKDISVRSGFPMTLCDFCHKQLLASDVTFGNHHTSDEAILISLITGCIFCTDLYHSCFVSQNPTSKPHSIALRHYRYRWVIRSTGRSHNTQNSFMVMFTEQDNTDGEGESALTTKRYHIISNHDVHVAAVETLPLSTDPNQQGGGSQISGWLKSCTDNHLHCNRRDEENAFVPTRLVDLEIGNVDLVRVVNTKDSDIKGPYLTLSHSWGPPNFLQLRKDNECLLTGPGVRISELTKNFQQAISVARFIGMRYLWIDSLCIMQGSGGDFKIEGQLMHKVYRYSYCNIAIADSADSTGGLFRNRDPRSIVPVTVEANGSGKLERGKWSILQDDLWDRNLLSSKIYTRGWVFQERMLAPRILHFAASQIFWDCSTVSACESLPNGLPHALDARAATDRNWRGRMQLMSDDSSKYEQPLVGAVDDSVETFWRSALLNYTSCNLTAQSDKSVAVWSIAKLVRDTLGEAYAVGMWENQLEEQLAWYPRDLGSENEARIPELQYRYPSWSWASLKGPILSSGRLSKARQYVITDHSGDAISFKNHPQNDDNQEPQLDRQPMPLLGYVARGSLSSTRGSDILTIKMHGGGSQQSSGSFRVFLDEKYPRIPGKQPTLYDFIILATSATSAGGNYDYPSSQYKASPGSTRYPPVRGANNKTLDEDRSSSEVTYSGIALLLTSVSAYKIRQGTRYKSLLREVVKRSPDQSWPDPPYGQGKSLVDRTEDMRLLIATLRTATRHVIKEGGTADSLYRRLGAIKFRDVPEELWKAMTKAGKRRIWLD